MSDGVELAAVLFDMDGTLVDSEKLWTVALERVAERLGRSVGTVRSQISRGRALVAATLGGMP